MWFAIPLALLVTQDPGPILDVAVSEGRVATARQGRVEVDGERVETGDFQITGVTFSPEGKPVVFGGRPGESGTVEVIGGWRGGGHEDLVYSVAFGNGWMASGGHDGRIVVRNRKGESLRVLDEHTGPVLALAAHPEGELLASAGADRTIRLWSAESGRLLRTISSHYERVAALVWKPDGRYLASGGLDRTVRIWQPKIGRLVRIVRKHEGEILDLAWGESLVSACSDGRVRVMDSASDKILHEFKAGRRVNAVALAGEEIVGVTTRIHRWKK